MFTSLSGKDLSGDIKNEYHSSMTSLSVLQLLKQLHCRPLKTKLDVCLWLFLKNLVKKN